MNKFDTALLVMGVYLVVVFATSTTRDWISFISIKLVTVLIGVVLILFALSPEFRGLFNG